MVGLWTPGGAGSFETHWPAERWFPAGTALHVHSNSCALLSFCRKAGVFLLGEMVPKGSCWAPERTAQRAKSSWPHGEEISWPAIDVGLWFTSQLHPQCPRRLRGSGKRLGSCSSAAFYPVEGTVSWCGFAGDEKAAAYLKTVYNPWLCTLSAGLRV